MTCPFFQKTSRRRDSDILWLNKDNEDDIITSQSGFNAIVDENQITYGSYLGLPKLLSAQTLSSSEGGKLTPVHDEHLFIITHQAFELWFKQILFEINSVREIFASSYLEERNQLTVISRLTRVSSILKLLCSQFPILETMTPQDFLEMRQFLANSSGFQSFQFRLMEIRLGVREELRVLYNKTNYLEVFFGEERKELVKARNEKSLFTLVNDWLERTPGIETTGFDFFNKFKSSVDGMHAQEKAAAEDCDDETKRKEMLNHWQKNVEIFNTLFDEDIHQDLVAKGQRRFSHKAMQGALMVYLYRDEPRCHLPFQLLQCLMDIDSYLTKFRYSHTCMVQRMIGGKIGTGGSSGYLYLRSTCSDRYKVFVDLMNLSSFLVTRDRIPPLTATIKKSLSIHNWVTKGNDDVCSTRRDSDSGIFGVASLNLRRVSRGSLGSFDKNLESFEEEEEISDGESGSTV